VCGQQGLADIFIAVRGSDDPCGVGRQLTGWYKLVCGQQGLADIFIAVRVSDDPRCVRRQLTGW